MCYIHTFIHIKSYEKAANREHTGAEMSFTG